MGEGGKSGNAPPDQPAPVHSLACWAVDSMRTQTIRPTLPGRAPATRKGIVNEERTTDDVGFGHKPPDPTVEAVIGIIAHGEIPVLRHGYGATGLQKTPCLVSQVTTFSLRVHSKSFRSGYRLAVSIQYGFPDLHCVSGGTHQAFDIVFVVRFTVPLSQ